MYGRVELTGVKKAFGLGVRVVPTVEAALVDRTAAYTAAPRVLNLHTAVFRRISAAEANTMFLVATALACLAVFAL